MSTKIDASQASFRSESNTLLPSTGESVRDALDFISKGGVSTSYVESYVDAVSKASELSNGAKVEGPNLEGIRTVWTVIDGLLTDPSSIDSTSISYEGGSVFDELKKIGPLQIEALFSKDNTSGKDYVDCDLYNPVVTHGVVNPSGGGGYLYNHDAALEYYDGRWIAMWNAGSAEGVNPQYVVQSTSEDFITWTSPVRSFTDPAYSNNPITGPVIVQWQPGLIISGTTLICVWTHNQTVYVSRKNSWAEKWTNTAISAPSIYLDGILYDKPFVSVDPIQLPSGRILAPVILMSDYPNSAFFTCYKVAVSLYSDDNGSTWLWGNPVTRYDNPAGIWENIYSIQDDGTVRMFMRNLAYAESPQNMLLSAISTDGGITWSSTRFVDQVSVSSRSFVIPGTNIMLAHDAPTDGVSSTSPRRNIAVWRGDQDDYVPGFGITPNDAPTPAYPEGRVRNGKVYMIYSSGFAEADRAIATAVFDAPKEGSLMPRNINGYYAGVRLESSPLRFNYSTRMTKISTTSDVTTSATQFSFSSIIRPINGSAILDSRGVSGASSGVVVKLDSGRVKLSLYNGSVFTDIDTGAVVPTTQDWLFVGGSFDGSAQTFSVHVVLPTGVATTTNFTLPSTYSLVNGGRVFMGSSVVGSSIPSVRDAHVIKYYDGILLTQNQHRATYNAYRAAVGMSMWVGAETAPPTVTSNFDSTRADAATNGPTWLADFEALATSRIGYYEVAMDGNVRALKMFKRQSAGISTENSNGARPKYTFRYKTPSSRSNTVVLATIGSYSNHIRIEKTKSGTAIRIKRSMENGTYNLSWTVSDDRWYTMGVSFGEGTLTIYHDLFPPQTITYFGKQVVFLGDAYDALSYSESDSVWIDADSVSVKKSSANLTTNMARSGLFEVGKWTPSIQFGGSSTGIEYDSSIRAGWFFKVGRLYFYSADILLTSKGSATGAATITGLPIGLLDEVGVANCFSCDVPFASGMSATTELPIFGRAGGSTNAITLARPSRSNTSVQAVLDTDFTNTTRLRISGVLVSGL